MDLKLYYAKIREQERKIEDPFPVVVSAATADGGKAGIRTEVPKAVAAKMIVDGVAELATRKDTNLFRQANAEAKAQVDEEAEAAKLRFTVVTNKGG